MKHANDNTPTRHIRDPFHRLFMEGMLHRHPRTNISLYDIGQRYARDFTGAGGSGIRSPNYERPVVDSGGYDPYRDVPIPDHLNKSKLYAAAAQKLDVIEARQLVEDIIVHGMPIVEAGRKHTGRMQEQQARAAAIAVLSIALLLLRDHYMAGTARKTA